jgi:hypothetical protein
MRGRDLRDNKFLVVLSTAKTVLRTTYAKYKMV